MWVLLYVGDARIAAIVGAEGALPELEFGAECLGIGVHGALERIAFPSEDVVTVMSVPSTGNSVSYITTKENSPRTGHPWKGRGAANRRLATCC